MGFDGHSKKTEMPAVEDIKSFCFMKMREKSTVGTRRWSRRWGVTRGDVLLLYKTDEEDRTENQHLAKAVQLRGKQVVIYAAATHNFTLGLQDVNLQQIVIWLRYDTEDDFNM